MRQLISSLVRLTPFDSLFFFIRARLQDRMLLEALHAKASIEQRLSMVSIEPLPMGSAEGSRLNRSGNSADGSADGCAAVDAIAVALREAERLMQPLDQNVRSSLLDSMRRSKEDLATLQVAFQKLCRTRQFSARSSLIESCFLFLENILGSVAPSEI